METKKQRLLSPNLLMFMGTMILANIAAQMIFPLQSLYIQELGANVRQIGLFFTLSAIAPLCLQIFGGWLSDSFGRLQAIAIGSVCGAAAYLFYIFAPSWQWVLPASILTAAAVSFVAPSFQAFIAQESTEETRGRVYGITSTMYMVVNIIGPVLGSAIAQRQSFRMMYIIAWVLYSTAAVIRVWMARRANRMQEANGDAPQKSDGFAGFRKSVGAVFALLAAGGIVTWIFISDGIRDISFSLTGQLMPIYLEDIAGLSVLQIGMPQSIWAMVAMAFMTPAGWLTDKKGERVGIVGGFSLIALGWFVFLNGGLFWHFIISRVILGIGWALIDPAYSSLISKAVPDKVRGIAFGLFSTSLGLISLPAPWIGAWLWDTVNPRFPFYAPLIAMLITLPIMWTKFKLPSEEESKRDAMSQRG
jgi:MFS family permease